MQTKSIDLRLDARAWEKQIEITLQAKRLGLLDHEVLRRK